MLVGIAIRALLKAHRRSWSVRVAIAKREQRREFECIIHSIDVKRQKNAK